MRPQGIEGRDLYTRLKMGGREYKLCPPAVLQDGNVREVREISVLTWRLIKGEAQHLQHHPTATTGEGFYVARAAETAMV